MVDNNPPRPMLSRRVVVTSGLSVGACLALAGCSVENPARRERRPATPAELAPDVAVATRALSEIRAVRMAVARTQARFPVTRAQLGPVVGMHAAHERTLVNAVPDQADTSTTLPAYAVPRRRATALRNLAIREQRLHDALDDLALRAQSGDFARLLASMGAALGQRLAGWQS